MVRSVRHVAVVGAGFPSTSVVEYIFLFHYSRIPNQREDAQKEEGRYWYIWPGYDRESEVNDEEEEEDKALGADGYIFQFPSQPSRRFPFLCR